MFRKSLKFDGPVSTLKVVRQSVNDVDQRLKRLSVLISSTIGPATVWMLKIEKEVIIGINNHHLTKTQGFSGQWNVKNSNLQIGITKNGAKKANCLYRDEF